MRKPQPSTAAAVMLLAKADADSPGTGLGEDYAAWFTFVCLQRRGPS
jgi:hypothetical protein